jgi:hypothetical protein
MFRLSVYSTCNDSALHHTTSRFIAVVAVLAQTALKTRLARERSQQNLTHRLFFTYNYSPLFTEKKNN